MERMYVVLAALSLAVTFSAFSEAPATKTAGGQDLFWFVLNENGDSEDAEDYSPGSTLYPTECPDEGSNICAIRAPKQEGTDLPDVTEADFTVYRMTP